MMYRTLALLLIAGVASAASGLIDHDADLVKSRALLVANQNLQIEMTLADVQASRAINNALSPQQLAHWKRLQSDLYEQRPNEARRKSIFDYEKQIGLTAAQVTILRKELVELNTLLEDHRKRIAANQSELRKLHPDLGLTEQTQLPRPETLLARQKELGLSASQVAYIKPVAERLAAVTNETRVRMAANQEAMRPLIAMEAPVERVKPFVRSDAELITELSFASLRASLNIHEKLDPKQRERWHIIEITGSASPVR